MEGRRLGRGLSAEVYAVDPDRALKLFHPWVDAEAVEREFSITRAVHGAGAPAPAAYEIVRAEGRPGILFERVDGHSMIREVELRPWRLFAVSRQLADLHARLHGLEAPARLPSQRDQIARWIAGAGLGPAEQERFRSWLAEAPDGTRLCHGDFHPGNVILSPRGPVLLDWSRATRGDPALDLARTSVLITDAELPPETGWHVRAMLVAARRLLHRRYLARYARSTGIAISAIERWRPLQKVATLFWQAQHGRAD